MLEINNEILVIGGMNYIQLIHSKNYNKILKLNTDTNLVWNIMRTSRGNELCFSTERGVFFGEFMN